MLLRIAGIALALVGPGVLALASDRFVVDGIGAVAFRAARLLAFCALVGAVALIAFLVERLSLAQVGFNGLSWATPVRAAAVTLFFIFIFWPLAYQTLATLGLQSFDFGRSKLAGLPAWFLIVATIIVASSEEWLYRGYAFGRLEAVVGNTWLAAAISLCFFSVVHRHGGKSRRGYHVGRSC